MSKNQVRQKPKKAEKVSSGIVYISTTFNNIIVTVTDSFGNALVASSAGKNGFVGAKKGTPFAAQVVADSVAKKVQEIYSMKTVVIIIKGPGSGREHSMRAIHASGLIVTEIKDITPVPHNGCRMSKRRRV